MCPKIWCDEYCRIFFGKWTGPNLWVPLPCRCPHHLSRFGFDSSLLIPETRCRESDANQHWVHRHRPFIRSAAAYMTRTQICPLPAGAGKRVLTSVLTEVSKNLSINFISYYQFYWYDIINFANISVIKKRDYHEMRHNYLVFPPFQINSRFNFSRFIYILLCI